MPGPKMGARPLDFDETIVRQAPTFQKWLSLATGQKLKYACRDFIKGHGEDEERLMRRIMIARRNNLRDHEILKKARAQTFGGGVGDCDVVAGRDGSVGEPPMPTMPEAAAAAVDQNGRSLLPNADVVLQNDVQSVHPVHPVHPMGALLPHPPNQSSNPDTVCSSPPDSSSRQHVHAHIPVLLPQKRSAITAFPMTDAEVLREMDGPAVEATRSYKSWLALENGAEFTYNQRYIRGKDGHDWLLRKNIWRRMRYRRENKKMVDKLKVERMGLVRKTSAALGESVSVYGNGVESVEAAIRRQDAGVGPASAVEPSDEAHAAVVEAAVAAVAAAELYVQSARESDTTARRSSSAAPTSADPPTPPRRRAAPDVAVKIEGGVDDACRTAEDAPHRAVGRSSDVDVGVMVHNPIVHAVSSADVERHPSMGLQDQPMVHTPNPLVGLHGNALDVAAKLAAAASASVSTERGEGGGVVEQMDGKDFARVQV